MEIVTSLAILIGSSFALIAAIGTHRFPDVLSRMHAATKAGAFATAILLVGVVSHFATWRVAAEALLVVCLFYLTAPIAAQALAKTEKR